MNRAADGPEGSDDATRSSGFGSGNSDHSAPAAAGPPASRELLEAIVGSAMDAFITIDDEQRIVLFNRAAEDMFRCPAAAALGSPLERFIPERFRTVHRGHVGDFLAHGTTARGMGHLAILWGLRANGEEFPIEASIAKAEIGGRRVANVIVRDISVRQRAQAEREHQLDYITEAAQIGYWDWDLTTDRREWSERCRAIFGLEHDEPIGYERFLSVLHPDDRTRTDIAIRRAIQGGREYDDEFRVRRPDGTLHWVHLKGRVEFDEDGQPVRMAGIAVEVTDYKRTEQALLDSRERLRLAQQVARVGHFEWDVVTNSVQWSPELVALYGLQADSFSSSCEAWLARIHPDDVSATAQRISAALKSGRFDAEWRVIWPDGSVHWLAGRAVVYKDAAGRPERVLGVNIDITEEKEVQETIRRVSQHDPLTDLPNRALIYEFAEHMLSLARRNGQCAAFLFVDLDRFKPINDTYGHNVGDAVLKEVARRLSSCVRGEDLVGRLGGDEFLAVLSNVRNEEDAAKVALNALHLLAEPYRTMGYELRTSPSIGISLYPQDGITVDALIKNADTAMYQAKQNGRHTLQFFRPALNARASEALILENRFHRGLEEREFVLHFQPVVDFETGRLVAAEALVRWPAMNVGPDRFIPVAETAGFMHTLGKWILEEACRHKRHWHELGLPEFPLAVNVSPIQFRHEDFTRCVADAIEQAGVRPDELRLELTESTVMNNVETVVEVLRTLRGFGVKVALDDFGTGYSSLSYLSHLPLDILKLDQSFIKEIGRNQGDRGSLAVLEAIIALARTLGLEVVAEGVESEKHIAFLRTRNCHYGQGYHFAHPLPTEEFESWCLRKAA